MFRPATDKQLGFIKTLLRQPHDPELDRERILCELSDPLLAAGIYKHEASKFISRLLSSVNEKMGKAPDAPLPPRPATEKQIAFIEKLMAKPHDEKLDEAYHPGLTTKEASALIDQLLKAA